MRRCASGSRAAAGSTGRAAGGLLQMASKPSRSHSSASYKVHPRPPHHAIHHPLRLLRHHRQSDTPVNLTVELSASRLSAAPSRARRHTFHSAAPRRARRRAPSHHPSSRASTTEREQESKPSQLHSHQSTSDSDMLGGHYLNALRLCALPCTRCPAARTCHWCDLIRSMCEILCGVN